MTLLEDEFLLQTNNMIEEVLAGPGILKSHAEKSLEVMARHLCLSSHAKRARPLLCLYFHWLFKNEIKSDFINVAVAAEFIHAASLLHDDVVDEAHLRRGKASANALYGNAQAVLAGDFLLTEAFDLLRPFGRDLTNQAILVVKEMTKASLVEINARGSMDLSEASWSTMARGKTGVLFSWCGFAAATCAENQEERQRLWALGQRVGHIFQMADDLKDFSGDQDLKDRCQDIRNKEPSLPIILAAHSDIRVMNAFKAHFAKDKISDAEVEYLLSLVTASGALKETRERITRAEAEAKMLIAPYENTLGKARLEQWMTALYP